MTMTSVLSPAASLSSARPQRDGFLQRLYGALELAGRRRAARQLVLLHDATLLRAGLDRADLEETLR